MNLTSKDLIDPHTEEGQELRDRLRLMNRRWDVICGQATRLQQELQLALMQCQEFHHTIHDLLLWLENIETKIQQCEPINLGNDEAALWSRLRKLQVLKHLLINIPIRYMIFLQCHMNVDAMSCHDVAWTLMRH